jgi:hypothetical protein
VKKSNICGSKNIFKKYKNPTGCIWSADGFIETF